MMTAPLSKNRHGFTLTEVLIAILVMVVLLALLFPVAGSLRKYGQTTKCLSNIRSYGMALLTYAGERNGVKLWDRSTADTTQSTKPQFNKWLTEGKYLPATPGLRCSLAEGAQYDDVPGRYRFPYAPNMWLAATYPRMAGFPVPASRVALVAEVNDWDGYESRTSLNSVIWRGSANTETEGEIRPGRMPIARYHGSPERRGLHFFFADGSARLVYPTDNDWTKAPICAPTTGVATTGYFYHSSHFTNLKNGSLTAP